MLLTSYKLSRDLVASNIFILSSFYTRIFGLLFSALSNEIWRYGEIKFPKACIVFLPRDIPFEELVIPINAV